MPGNQLLLRLERPHYRQRLSSQPIIPGKEIERILQRPSQSWAGTVMTFNSLIIQKYTIMENNTNNASRGEIVIYQTADGTTAVDVRLENDTVWLSQEMMSRLFKKDRTVIGRHIRNIYSDGELREDSTCAKFAHTGEYGQYCVSAKGKK